MDWRSERRRIAVFKRVRRIRNRV